jgi:gas vesicle protein
MSDHNNMNGKDFLLGAVVGGLLGAVTALLLAPKAGSELRSDLSEQYQNVSEKTQKIAGDVSERTQKIAGDVSQRTQVLASTVSEKSKEYAGKAKEAAESVTNEIKSWKEVKKEAADAAEDIAEAVDNK